MANTRGRPVPNIAQRKLLEDAAKAGGIGVEWRPDGFFIDATQQYWNPITHAGDAMELAKKLLMSLHMDPREARAWIGDDIVIEGRMAPFDNLLYAIVQLAARLGSNSA